MDLFFCLCILFYFGSICGWIIELFFRRFVSSKKWINPGFLNGPYLPIYGTGICVLFLISRLIHFDTSFNIHWFLNDLIIILIMTILMTFIELIAGLIFIKGMNIKLWDYSDRKFNYKGIICPTFSLIWGIIGALFYYLIYGLCEDLLTSIDITNPYIPLCLGVFYGIFIVDLCISFNLSFKIRKIAKEKQIVIKFEKLKESIRDIELNAKRKFNFLLPFKSALTLKENLENYVLKIKEKRDKKKQK